MLSLLKSSKFNSSQPSENMNLKILHTADWHLGKKLDYFSRLEEQKQVLNEICEIADDQQVDVVIIAGDLFDTFNPPVEAIDLFYSTLKRLSKNGQRPVIAIAGNHDSPDRIDVPNPLAIECGIIFMGYPNAVVSPITIENGFTITKTDKGFFEIQLPKFDFPLRIIATPYANEMRLKQYLGSENREDQLNEVLKSTWTSLADQYCDNSGANILTTHLYMLKRGGEILEEPDGEKPIMVGNADFIYSDCIPSQIQYTALGHLHRYQNISNKDKPVVYSSSPLPYSFSEAGQEKKVVIIEASPNSKVKFTPIVLTSGRTLHRVRFSSISETVNWLLNNPNTLVELTIESDTFISTEDLKTINNSHDGIIHIIPIIKKIDEDGNQIQTGKVNLDQDINGIFVDYFKAKNKLQEPNEELLALFKEVLTPNKIEN